MNDEEPRTILRLNATERAFIAEALRFYERNESLDTDELLLAAQLMVRMT